MRSPAQDGLPLPIVLAWRYLRGGGSRLLHRTAIAALASVALGVMAMVVAMALMTGYRQDLEAKLVGGNAAVLAYPLVPRPDGAAEATAARLADLPEVTRVGQVAYGQGTVSTAGSPGGEAVTLRGVEGADPLAGDADLSPDAAGVPGAVLGAELASRLETVPGDVLRLVVLGFADGRPSFEYQAVRVAGTFRSGFAEFDRSWMVLPRRLVERLGSGGGATLFELAVEDPQRARAVADRAEELLGADYLVTDWQRLNRELFSALRLQQLGLFFLLGLIVLVSTFNVASTLMVLVRERMREVGVLASLGLDRTRLAGSFVLYGGFLGLVGTGIGVGLGSAISWLFDRYEIIRFDPEVAEIYFLAAVPFRVRGGDLAAIVGFAVGVTLLASLVPAWRVVRLQAAEALRYE